MELNVRLGLGMRVRDNVRVSVIELGLEFRLGLRVRVKVRA